jgi:two-component sensor histidine kinase
MARGGLRGYGTGLPFQLSIIPMIESNDPILQGGGECGSLLRAIDWSSNPLGKPAQWPAELRTIVGIALNSKQPMLIVWGPEQTTLYNDGYAALCGVRHPAALGGSFQELWYDIWEKVEPIITAAYNGISTSMDDIEFTMHRHGRPEQTHFAFSYTPVRNGQGEVLGMFCACVETTRSVQLTRQREAERDHMLQVFEKAVGAIAMVSGPTHVFTYANEDYLALVGHRDVVGKTVAEALPEVGRQGFIELLDQVFESGASHIGRGQPLQLQGRPNAEPELRYVDFFYHPTRGADGQVDGIFVQAIDVTDKLAAEQYQTLLNRELGHRMKNQLALVQAIVGQTLRSADSLEMAGKSLSDRVAVLATAHDILINGVGRTTVHDIVRQAAALHDGNREHRLRIEGPELVIASRPALSLALIIHELSTNAAKYGSLSTQDGFVNVRWRVEGNHQPPRFVFEWQEQGGPQVAEPTRKGSGSRLIRAGLSGTIENSVNVDYAPGGLRCEIVAELSSLQTES